MKYKVKQIHLTDSQVDEVNNSKSHPDFYNSYLDLKSRPTKKLITDNKHMFETRGIIEGDSHDNVFHIGNVWYGYEQRIEQLNGGMSSLSVGDVLIDEDGKAVAVDRRGFIPIDWD
jgi:hypothetical protein